MTASRNEARYGLWACAIVLATSSCGGGTAADGEPTEEQRARAAAAEVAKNCHNPAQPDDSCATVEDLSRTSAEQWRARIRLFNGRDICVTIHLDKFERVGDNLHGVDRVAC